MAGEPGRSADGDRAARVGRQVASTVVKAEVLTRLLAAVLFGALWLAPIVVDIRLGDDPALAVAAGIVFGFCAAAGSLFLGQRLAEPIRMARYRGAARALEAEMLRLEPRPLARHGWYVPLPGFAAVLANREFVLVDASTGYVLTRIPPSAIRAIVVEHRDAARNHAPALAIAGGWRTSPGLSGLEWPKRDMRAEHSAAVSLQYRDPQTGSLRTTTIPFGADVPAAERLAAALRQGGGTLSVRLRNRRSA